MTPIKQVLAECLEEALRQASGVDVPAADVVASFEIPREERFGDISSHSVLKLAKQAKTAPRPLADKTAALLSESLGHAPLAGRVERIAVEGPGFINFYYSKEELCRVLAKMGEQKDAFGRPSVPKKKILLEFVSANPTGPLTVAHGRQAALGDSLALILEFCGHEVSREYYNNDEGVQIETLGKSTALRAEEILSGKKSEALPENYYQGAYLTETAGTLILRRGREAFQGLPPEQRVKECTDFAKEYILEGIKKDLEDFGVRFDRYYSQAALMKSGQVEKTLELLRQKGFVYESEGATWFASTRLGDDKDRVLIKSDKAYTYLMPDIAYHRDKLSRGYDLLINILGPDHHGYIARLKAAVEALGNSRGQLEILIAQLVTLFEGEKTLRMSTRAGEFVTLREIMDEVGRDAGRFFFLMRKFDAHLDFDLALAKSQTVDNPVFYIQYAHARIESIKKTYLEKNGRSGRPDPQALSRLGAPSEIQVLRLLSQFEDTVLAAAKTLEPFRLVHYLKELAAAFHKFYTENRVVTDDVSLTQARMTLAEGVQQVLRTGLRLLGVSAPLKM